MSLEATSISPPAPEIQPAKFDLRVDNSVAPFMTSAQTAVEEYAADSPYTTLTDHADIKTGRKFPVLPQAERDQARKYIHTVCRKDTKTTPEIVFTVLVNPCFYDGLWCKHCKKMVMLEELVWAYNKQCLVPGQKAVVLSEEGQNDEYYRQSFAQLVANHEPGHAYFKTNHLLKPV